MWRRDGDGIRPRARAKNSGEGDGTRRRAGARERDGDGGWVVLPPLPARRSRRRSRRNAQRNPFPISDGVRRGARRDVERGDDAPRGFGGERSRGGDEKRRGSLGRRSRGRRVDARGAARRRRCPSPCRGSESLSGARRRRPATAAARMAAFSYGGVAPAAPTVSSFGQPIASVAVVSSSKPAPTRKVPLLGDASTACLLACSRGGVRRDRARGYGPGRDPSRSLRRRGASGKVVVGVGVGGGGAADDGGGC